MTWARRIGDRAPLISGVAVTCIIAVLLVWSRHGQSTSYRIDARGGHFETLIDGRPSLSGDLESPENGGIDILWSGTAAEPALPKPAGLDELEVVAIPTGAVIFRDSFDAWPGSPQWSSTHGTAKSIHGVLVATAGPARIHLNVTCGDCSVRLRTRNVSSVEIGVRSSDANNGVFLGARPVGQLDSSLSSRQGGKTVKIYTRPDLQVRGSETMKSIVAMAFRPSTLILLLLAGVLLGVVALGFLAPFVPKVPHRPTALTMLAVVVVGGFALVALVRLMDRDVQRVPHVPDELAYIFQAKVLASGHLSAPPPPATEPFEWSNPSPVAVQDGRWASTVPPGHVLMLAVGAAAGLIWLIPPVLGALTVFLLFELGRRCYDDDATGVAAATLWALSPFFLMTASNFMSHNTASFYLVAALVLMERSGRGDKKAAVGAGLFFGLFFTTRPLSGAVLVAPIGLFVVLEILLARERRLQQLLRFQLLAVGAAIALCLYVGYRYEISGTLSLFDQGQGSGEVLGFGGRNSASIGLSNDQAQLNVLLLVLNNLPLTLGLSLVFLPFILGSVNKWDWLFLGCAAILMAAYTLYLFNGIMHGPRYWYEPAPLLMLLSARGLRVSAQRIASVADWLLAKRGRTSGTTAGFAYALIAVPVLALSGRASYQWLFHTADWAAEFVPASARSLRGFNGTDNRMASLISARDLTNSLVLVDDCGRWQCYGSLFWLNSPRLNNETIYVRNVADKPATVADVLRAFPDRYVYRANFDKRTLEPFMAGTVPSDKAPKAADLVQAFTATDVPEPPGGKARDGQRLSDLRTVAGLLSEYYTLHGEYPTSPNPQTLCNYAFDSGCALNTVGSVPRDPKPGWDYLYWSTGQDFIVLAKLEASDNACDISLPPGLRQAGPVACTGTAALP